MTNKDVARVDVVVDGIKRVEPEGRRQRDDWTTPSSFLPPRPLRPAGFF